jgi:serine/threonine protein kinase
MSAGRVHRTLAAAKAQPDSYDVSCGSIQVRVFVTTHSHSYTRLFQVTVKRQTPRSGASGNVFLIGERVLRIEAISSEADTILQRQRHVLERCNAHPHKNVLGPLQMACTTIPRTDVRLLVSTLRTCVPLTRMTGVQHWVQITHDVASALEHLAALDVVHADVKADNVMHHPHGHYVLGDMGCARMGTCRFRHITANVHARAPERT